MGQGHTFDLFTLICLEEETGLNFPPFFCLFFLPSNVLNRVVTRVWPLAITHPTDEADDSNLFPVP